MVLFVIGFGNLMLQSNLIKNYRAEYYGYGSIPLLAEKGYITGRAAPIVADGVQKRGGIYQSGSQRPCTDRDCGVSIRFGLMLCHLPYVCTRDIIHWIWMKFPFS